MNGPVRAGIVGAILLIIAIVIMVGVGAYSGLYNVAADTPHTAPVRIFIGFVREHSVASRDRDITVPVLTDSKMIAEGASDYDAMCTGCHLAPGMAENEMRPGLNPKPPILARRRRPGNPAEQFWVIKHGFKMTAMPAWGLTHSDAEIWNMVAFLQVMPKLSPATYKALTASAAGHHEHDQDMPGMDMTR